jgi:diacylglycerol kinase family enzyme
MGFLCVGRGNDFAFGMGVPQDLATGCRLLAQDHRRVVDVGHVTGGLFPQGRYFGNGVGIGFDAVVGFEALKLKWLTGFPSYIVATLKTVFLYYHAPLLRVEYDGQLLEQKALMLSVMNGRRMGGGFYMAPQGLVDDGLFDLCMAREVSRARVFSLVPHFMKGTQSTQSEIKMDHARRVVVTALEGVLPAHADGETLCVEGKQLTLELLPQQMEVICEARSK